MSAMMSQIGVSIVYSDACPGFRGRSKKHQSSASLAFVRGIHRWPVDSPHKGPVTRKMFPFVDVITTKPQKAQHSDPCTYFVGFTASTTVLFTDVVLIKNKNAEICGSKTILWSASWKKNVSNWINIYAKDRGIHVYSLMCMHAIYSKQRVD